MTKVAVDSKKRRKKKGTEETPTPVHHIGHSGKRHLLDLAAEHGTPVFVINHEKIRQNYREFR